MTDQAAYKDNHPVKRVYPSKLLGASLIGDEELAELKDVIAEKSLFRHYGIGDPQKVISFEKEVALFLGSKFALGVSSGSAALFCAMAAINVQPGDEVILPAFAWYSDYNAIVSFGACPVFAAIDDTMCLSPEDFERKITARTKAVVVIHYQGSTGRLEEIVRTARKRGILVIEDAAQAFGGEYDGRRLGTFGDIAISSFQNNKMITCGEGGLVYTDDEALFERALRYHDLGFVRDAFANQFTDKSLSDNIDRPFAGNQFRMGELQGAVLRAQLRKLPMILNNCRNTYQRIADGLDKKLKLMLRPVHGGHCGIALFLGLQDGKTADAMSLAMTLEGVPVGVASSCTNLLNVEHIRKGKLVNGHSAPFALQASGPDRCSEETDAILSRYVGIGIGPLYTGDDADEIARCVNGAARSVLHS